MGWSNVSQYCMTLLHSLLHSNGSTNHHTASVFRLKPLISIHHCAGTINMGIPIVLFAGIKHFCICFYFVSVCVPPSLRLLSFTYLLNSQGYAYTVCTLHKLCDNQNLYKESGHSSLVLLLPCDSKIVLIECVFFSCVR